MAIGRRDTSKYGQGLVEMFRQAEAEITQHMAGQLARGMGRSDWAESKLREVGSLRRFMETLIRRLDAPTQNAVTTAILRASQTGRRAALAEAQAFVREPGAAGPLSPRQRNTAGILADLQAGLGQNTAPGFDRTARLAAELTDKIGAAQGTVLRTTVDKYRQIIGETTAQVTLGVKTQRQAATAAWGKLMGSGLTGFQDSRGRNWSLDSYVDMATRTTLVQASVQSHLDQLAGLDIHLVQVSNSPQECYLCRPWEGKVLDTRDGQSGPHTVTVQHGIHDREVTVRVAGSVSEARSAGLFHPNCRHSLAAFIPGVSTMLTNTADPQGEKDRDKLRALERQARQDKLRLAGAIDPEERRAAQARVKASGQAIAGHVKATGLQRQRGREAVHQGFGPPPAAPPPPPPPPPRPRPPTPPAPAPAPVQPSTRPVTPGTIGTPTGPSTVITPSHAGYTNEVFRPRAIPGYTPDRHQIAAARTNLGIVSHDAPNTRRTARTSRAALEYTAELTPRSSLRLQGVWHPGPGTDEYRVARDPTALAFYTPWDTSAKPFRQGCVVMNPDVYNDANDYGRDEMEWMVRQRQLGRQTQKVPPPPGVQAQVRTAIHEYGHHILERARGGDPWASWSADDIETAFEGWTRELGIAGPRAIGNRVHFDEVTAWIKANQSAIALRVSGYGTTNMHEFTAESFAYYAMWGDACPPYVVQYVETMIKLAEGLS